MNQNWKVLNFNRQHDMICYFKYCNIPVVTIIDDIVWVSLDLRITKPVLKIIKHLMKLEIKFYLTSRSIVHQKVIYEDNLSGIIFNYINALLDPLFFDGLFDIGFDHIKNLSDFMTEFECHHLFKDAYEIIKKKSKHKYIDWFENKEYYSIKREDIRDFITTIEREIKLTMLL